MSGITPANSGDSATAPPVGNSSSQNAANGLRDVIRQLSRQQSDLVEARQQVLVDRQELHSSEKGIQNQRRELAEREARLMDVFRRCYTHLEMEIPHDLALIYAEVEIARTNLVATEDTRDTVQKGLEISEWALIEKEEDFYHLELSRIMQAGCHDEQDRAVQRADSALLEGHHIDMLIHHGSRIEQHVNYNGTSRRHSTDNEDNLQVEAHQGTNVDGVMPQQHNRDGSLARLLATTGNNKHVPSVENWLSDYMGVNVTERLLLLALVSAEMESPIDSNLGLDQWIEAVTELWTRQIEQESYATSFEHAQHHCVLQDDHCASELDSVDGYQSEEDYRGNLPWQYSQRASSSISSAHTTTDLRLHGKEVQGLHRSRSRDHYKPRISMKRHVVDTQLESPRDLQPDMPFPSFEVTAAADDSVTRRESTDSPGHLGAGNTCRERCDSAHNSDVVEDHHPDEASSDPTNKSDKIELESKEVPDSKTTDCKDIAWLPVLDDLTTEEVVYSNWTWSSELHLYYSNGFYDDDEVSESIWFEHRDTPTDS